MNLTTCQRLLRPKYIRVGQYIWLKSPLNMNSVNHNYEMWLNKPSSYHKYNLRETHFTKSNSTLSNVNQMFENCRIQSTSIKSTQFIIAKPTDVNIHISNHIMIYIWMEQYFLKLEIFFDTHYTNIYYASKNAEI